MDDKKDNEKKEKKEDFADIGFGELGDIDRLMSRMMKDFEKMFGGPEMGDMMGGMFKDIEKMFEDPSAFANIGKPKVYGFSMKLGPDGKPEFQRFGDVQKIKPEVPEAREPFTEIIDKRNEINIIIELPGVDKGDIELKSKGNELTVKVDKGDKKFFKKIMLPNEVKSSIKSTYKNGILEVILIKKN